MASYKVIQDIEAEDKLVGPLTLRQCIYAAVASLSLYICFLLFSKGAAFMMIFFLPIAAVAGFFAFPWQGEQPTEIWALARLRYMLKPRVRIWDQDGVKDLVTVLAPKKIEQRRSYKDSLTQREVKSRLKALADTIDSRGWATRNAAYGFAGQQWTRPTVAPVPGSTPVAGNIQSNDMFDPANSVAQSFDAMLTQSSAQQRQRAIQQMTQPQPAYPSPPPPAQPAQSVGYGYYQAPQLPAPVMPIAQAASQPQGNWFADGPAYPTAPITTPTPQQAPTTPSPYQQPVAFSRATPGLALPPPATQSTYIESDAPIALAATPTPEEAQLGENIRQQNQNLAVNYGHMRVLQPATASSMPQDMTGASQAPGDYTGSTPGFAQAGGASGAGAAAAAKPVTRTPDPAILELANNDDLDIATIARQASRQIKQSPDEVEIRLH